MSREQYEAGDMPPNGARSADKDTAELDAFNEEVVGNGELAGIVEAMTATLPEEELPAAGWEALRVKLSAPDGSFSTNDVTRTAGTAGAAGTAGTTGAAGAREATGTGRANRAAHKIPSAPSSADASSRRPYAGAARWAMAAVLAAAVVVAGSWGSLKAAEAAKLRDDQRILAYWMANPDMRLVALSAPGSTSRAGPARLGVVCVLPDGRALLLQPTAAPRGATYLVTGQGPTGTTELARGRSNMLQFDASGVQSVEVVLARGSDEAEPVAEAVID